MTDSIPHLTARIRAFAEARDWEQFHTPKNLTMALIVEAAELVELYQWLTPEEALALTAEPEGRAAVADELADIAIYLMRLADVVGLNLSDEVLTKIERNEVRFPASRRGDLAPDTDRP